MIRSEKITKSAKGEDCTMESPMCNGNPDTVVWCHSNYREHGKGVGLKSHDIFGFFGCQGCHDWYDVVSRDRALAPTRRFMFDRAFARSLIRLVQKGIVKIEGMR